MVQWNEPSEIGAGFKEVAVEENTAPIQFDYDALSKDTQFHPLRDIQKQVLGPMMEAVKGGYRNIELECPTGSGKSALAKTIAKRLESPHILSLI